MFRCKAYSKLSALLLNFPGAFKRVYQLPPTQRLKDLFPSLQILKIQEPFGGHGSHKVSSTFLRELPFLQTLLLPQLASVDATDIRHLPQSLTDVTLTLGASTSLDTDPEFPPQLAFLQLRKIGAPFGSIYKWLPRTISSLILRNAQSVLPESEEGHLATLRLLPPSITRLSLGNSNQIWKTSHLKLLSTMKLSTLQILGHIDTTVEELLLSLPPLLSSHLPAESSSRVCA
jgi:hypothetical protein